MSPPVVLILLDACRGEYLTRGLTPFLARLSEAGYYAKRVRHSWGFCERSEILSGRDALENGYLAAVGYDPAASPYKKWAKVLKTVAHLSRSVPHPLSDIWRRGVRFGLRKLGPGMKPYWIPFEWLPLFALTEDRWPPTHPDAYGGNSIIREVHHNGKTVAIDSFTYLGGPRVPSDHHRMRLASRALDNHADLILVYLGSLDVVGHRYGPESSQMNAVLADVDTQLEAWIGEWTRKHPDIRILIIGDHGMHSVKGAMDAAEIVHSIKEVAIEDCWWFVDSTMLRVWCANNHDRNRVRQGLEEAFGGRGRGFVISEDDPAWEAVLDSRTFGDIIAICNPGWVLSPDFYRGSSVPCGMHGYDPSIDDEKGMLIGWGHGIGRNVVEEVELTVGFQLLQSYLEFTGSPVESIPS